MINHQNYYYHEVLDSEMGYFIKRFVGHGNGMWDTMWECYMDSTIEKDEYVLRIWWKDSDKEIRFYYTVHDTGRNDFEFRDFMEYAYGAMINMVTEAIKNKVNESQAT